MLEMHSRTICGKYRQRRVWRRTGSMVTELLVAATLLLSSITIASQLTIQSRRLWVDVRHHQLALDELSNQLERLVTLDTETAKSQLARLEPSESAEQTLANVKLQGNWLDDDDGRRITLSIQWDRPAPATPLTMMAWVVPPGVHHDE